MTSFLLLSSTSWLESQRLLTFFAARVQKKMRLFPQSGQIQAPLASSYDKWQFCPSGQNLRIEGIPDKLAESCKKVTVYGDPVTVLVP